jgi:hypothetical protein
MANSRSSAVHACRIELPSFFENEEIATFIVSLDTVCATWRACGHSIAKASGRPAHHRAVLDLKLTLCDGHHIGRSRSPACCRRRIAA